MFLNNCRYKILAKVKKTHVSCHQNSKGLILRIGSRKSPNYYRVYEKENGLEFEHEMKGNFLQDYHKLLVSNDLQEFEQKLS